MKCDEVSLTLSIINNRFEYGLIYPRFDNRLDFNYKFSDGGVVNVTGESAISYPGLSIGSLEFGEDRVERLGEQRTRHAGLDLM